MSHTDENVPVEQRKVPFVIKVYGALCFADGLISLPILLLFFGLIGYALVDNPSAASIGSSPSLTLIVTVFGAVLSAVTAFGLIVFGWALLRNHRRNAGRWSYVLIVLTILQLLVDVMLQGISSQLIVPAVQLVILIALSATIDPMLRREREMERKLRDLNDLEAAREGMLGRDLTGEGYIKLNFFNLFWVFVVCSVLGLIIETIFHMVVVDPGVYQDRAGVLFGPFSPIYGFGAVLMTVALNRFYRKSPILIFLVSAVIGGAFEFFVSWFLQTAFGVTAWDYSGTFLSIDGRTNGMFMCMWGLLGLVWIKLCLPRMLKLINLIPWKLRYSFTAVCAILMLVDGVMTLQALDCWFERVSGMQPNSPVEEFYAEHFDNAYMEHRFQSMSINPSSTSRVEHEG